MLSAKYRYMYSTVQESKNATQKPNLSGTTRKDCLHLWRCPWRLFGDCWNYRSKKIDCKRYSFTLRPRRKDTGNWKTARWRQSCTSRWCHAGLSRWHYQWKLPSNNCRDELQIETTPSTYAGNSQLYRSKSSQRNVISSEIGKTSAGW